MKTETNINNGTGPKTTHKVLIGLLLILSMLASITGTAMAGPGDDDDGPIILEGQLEPEDDTPVPQIGGDTPLELRRYTVSLRSFLAVDETGWDWTGSDEMSFLMGLTYGYTGTGLIQSDVYGDVDTGETHTFGPQDSCAVGVGCTSASRGVAGPFYVTVAGVEHDDEQEGWDEYMLQGVRDLLDAFIDFDGEALEEGTFFGDIYHALGELYYSVMGNDQIGSASAWIDEDELAAAMPYVGRGMQQEMDISGWGGDFLIDGDGHYRVTVQIRRVADAEPEAPETTGGSTTQAPELGDVAVDTSTTTSDAGSSIDLPTTPRLEPVRPTAPRDLGVAAGSGPFGR